MDKVSKLDATGWVAVISLAIIFNTLITLLLYPAQKPTYWWFPGAWIFFQLYDRLWIPFRDWLYSYTIDPNSKDPNKRRKFFAPPRIA